MKFGGQAAIAAVALLVTGCGGGGGGGSSGSGPVTVPPVAVTPTPTPTPPPSPLYQTFANPQADWTATPPFVLTEVAGTSSSPTRAYSKSSFQVGVIEAVFSAKPIFSGHFADFFRGRFSNFSEKDIAVSNDLGVFFSKTNPDFSVTTMGTYYPKTDSYRYGYLARTSVDHQYLNNPGNSDEFIRLHYDFLIGQKTLDTDLPFEDRYYNGLLFLNNEANHGFPVSSVGVMTFSVKNGTLSGQVVSISAESTGRPFDNFRVNITGTIDPQTRLISGDLSSDDGAYTGKIQGNFYGPRGKEIGLLVHMKSKDGKIATAGALIGYSSAP